MPLKRPVRLLWSIHRLPTPSTPSINASTLHVLSIGPKSHHVGTDPRCGCHDLRYMVDMDVHHQASLVPQRAEAVPVSHSMYALRSCALRSTANSELVVGPWT